MSTIDDAILWLAAREPAVPAPLLEHTITVLRSAEIAEASLPELLARCGMTALERAVKIGDDRAGAADLLAADALLTWACEAAAEQGDDALECLVAAADVSTFQALHDKLAESE